ncbi:MAG: hypothetical protein H6748_07235 [Spirochaetaceae bacterium]|nr:hypothetical protein [Myxococcales bacterium]MCB9723819.1 hypothetical protein [Spirochaetaceae bacterium]HPG24004.1 hypothetical protein [Myxococcota bacterium]
MTQKHAGWTAESMRELGERHARVETECDLEATMATLVDEPVYEFWPVGRRMRGRDAVRRYYTHLMQVFMPSQRGFALVEEWLSEASLAQEYAVDIAGDDGPETHRVIGVLIASAERDGLLAGERIWASEAFLRRMLGPAWDELEPI